MKKSKSTTANPGMVRETAPANNLLVPQHFASGPASRIVSWNWEPLHETYVFAKNVKGAA